MLGFCKVLLAAAVEMPQSTLAQVPGGEVLRPLGQSTLPLSFAKFWFNGSDDTLGQIILNREYACKLTVVAFSPKVGSGRAINQLSRETHLISGFSNATLQNVSGSKVTCDLPNILVSLLVAEDGVACDHMKPANPRERRDKVFGNTIREVVIA